MEEGGQWRSLKPFVPLLGKPKRVPASAVPYLHAGPSRPRCRHSPRARHAGMAGSHTCAALWGARVGSASEPCPAPAAPRHAWWHVGAARYGTARPQLAEGAAQVTHVCNQRLLASLVVAALAPHWGRPPTRASSSATSLGTAARSLGRALRSRRTLPAWWLRVGRCACGGREHAIRCLAGGVPGTQAPVSACAQRSGAQAQWWRTLRGGAAYWGGDRRCQTVSQISNSHIRTSCTHQRWIRATVGKDDVGVALPLERPFIGAL